MFAAPDAHAGQRWCDGPAMNSALHGTFSGPGAAAPLREP
jgi:hypothetical protein